MAEIKFKQGDIIQANNDLLLTCIKLTNRLARFIVSQNGRIITECTCNRGVLHTKLANNLSASLQ